MGKKRNEKKIILTALAGTCICVLFALIFFGPKFNAFDRPPIYISILGFAGSLSLALFKQRRTRDVIYINILIFFLFTILILNIMKAITVVVLLIYFTAMLFAVYIYVKYFDKKLTQLWLARPLVLAALVGLFYIAANFLHGLLFISQFSTKFLLGNLPIGFLLGLGYGIGNEISEKYFDKVNL